VILFAGSTEEPDRGFPILLDPSSVKMELSEPDAA